MSQSEHRDLEGSGNLGHAVGHHDSDQPQSTSNHSLQGESNFGDSSGPLFSIYSKAADDEDDEMVERWQKDADGILIFTGLFSAAVAALLAVTVQDLRPNSQDTSAFYLGNIYEVLANPNVTRAPIPFPVTKQPPFSPPRYAIWVNSLWFLSLVISLTCALLATSQHQWARRYIRVTQPARCSPEKRARMRAFFAEGSDKMHIPWAVEGLPTLLHLSLFLFFGGLVIFLFNTDHAVFSSVIWWIGLFSIVYGLITVMPIGRHDSPYYAPLSRSTWFLYAGMNYVLFKILASKSHRSGTFGSWRRFSNLKDRYHGWMLGGVEKAAEETVSGRSSEIDIRIFDWTIGVLGEDDSLEKFFEAIPGFFSSKLVKNLESDFPEDILHRFWSALNGFMNRTLSSNSVIESVKTRRVTICRDIMSMIPCPFSLRYNSLTGFFDQAPVSIERLQAMARWCTHKNDYVADYARVRVIKNLVSIQERDDDWIALASGVCGLTADDLRSNITHGGENLLLATLIDVSRRAIHHRALGLVTALTQFDILKTLPGLQHGFCMLWNEIAQEAGNQGPYTTPVHILRWIRHLYISLHQGTDAALSSFSALTYDFHPDLDNPSSYPLCDIASHRQDLTTQTPVSIFLIAPPPTPLGHFPDAWPHPSTSDGSAASQPIRETNITAGPPLPSDQTTAGEIADASQAPTATFPVHSSSASLVDRSPQGIVAVAQPDTTSAATLSIPLESNKLEDQVTLWAAPLPDISEISSTVPTPAPVLASTPLVTNKLFATCDANSASISKSSLPALSGFSDPENDPDPPPPPHVPHLPNADLLSLTSDTSPKGPSDNATVPRLLTRRLVDDGNIRLANAVLQLLVKFPPFLDLFRDLGCLMGQDEGGEAGGGTTPLIDATIRFLDEFTYKDKSSLTRKHQSRKSARGKTGEDGDRKKEGDSIHPFLSTYAYDAMKKKRQFVTMRDGQMQDAAIFLGLYLEALDEELVTLQHSLTAHRPVSTLKAEELEEGAQSGEDQTEVGKRDHTASSAESPISPIFDRRSSLIARVPNWSDTITVQDWRLLELDIQPDSVHSVEDALPGIPQPRPVVGQLSPSEVIQQVPIEALPPVLVLHLKRFLHDAAADDEVKINKPVQFAPELEIPQDVMVPVAGESTEPVHYKLYGVLYHHGNSAASGHYTVDVLRSNRDSGSGEGWLHIDDEAVSAVQHEGVFGGHDNERVDGRCVYMLFYCRTAPLQT